MCVCVCVCVCVVCVCVYINGSKYGSKSDRVKKVEKTE